MCICEKGDGSKMTLNKTEKIRIEKLKTDQLKEKQLEKLTLEIKEIPVAKPVMFFHQFPGDRTKR